MTNRRILRIALPALLLLGILLVAGCTTDSPQNTFAPEGDTADEQRDLFQLVMWPALAILILVEAGLVFSLVRFRRRRDDELPKQVHGNTRLELAWTIAPALLLAVLAVPTLATIVDLAEDPGPEAMQVDVIGRQWSWEFQYPEFTDANGEPVVSINELHIPVGKKIRANMQSADIIHSFWVPRLAGKIDVIPGTTNHLTFNANKPGDFAGQCAEFCGLGHALMRMTIIAQPEAEFMAWIDEQRAKASSSPEGAAVAAMESGNGD